MAQAQRLAHEGLQLTCRYTCTADIRTKGTVEMRNYAVFLLGIVTLALAGAIADAADLNGKWRGDLKTPNGDNLEINLNFHVDGEKLTGTVTNTYGEEQIT